MLMHVSYKYMPRVSRPTHTCKLHILCLSDFSTSTVLCWETWEMQAHSLDMCRVCGCPLGVQSQGPSVDLHTTLYESAAGCRSIQKTCALWKHGLTSKNIQSQLTYFCKSNINQTSTNGSGIIWGVRIAIFTEIRHLVEELITFLSIFGPQKLVILTARLNKSLSISTSIQWEGICVSKHGQNLHSQQD